MFDDYLTNPITYDRLEQRFLDHFDAGISAARLRPEDFRSPHYNVFFVDGTKDREANPIFSAKHLPSGNIVRIVIFESHPEYTEVHNRVGDNDDKDELCLFMALPDMQRAMDMTVAWAKQQAS
ncbi:hypothetical protein [Stenotrophomonas indicatrix]|jgi:hypothetical protein|uniref:hypothetical protein n=1 Tax=Stenotrophomonas indicatrix TaxID=2045451 RepID=UPI0028B1036A|nr:hypothetical protein [Stenotrophomonas indicatrix]